MMADDFIFVLLFYFKAEYKRSSYWVYLRNTQEKLHNTQHTIHNTHTFLTHKWGYFSNFFFLKIHNTQNSIVCYKYKIVCYKV
jgi:hypothetical protein